MKKTLAALLLTIPMLTIAGTAGLTWEKPSQREDGSVLTQEEISKYLIEYYCVGYDSLEIDIQGNIYSAVISDIYGNCGFRILTIDSDGIRSRWSATIFLDMGIKPLNPISTPTILDIVESINIYWDIPKTRGNGDPLPLGAIESFDIAYRCNNQPEQLINVIGNIPETNIEGLYGNCRFKVRANDSDGLSSPWSNQYKLLLKLRTPQGGGFR